MNAEKNFKKSIANENIAEEIYLGVVVNAEDPLFEGRCKINVFGKFDDLSEDAIPWAYPANATISAGGSSKGAGQLFVPKKGQIFKVKFIGGNVYSPEYYTVQNINDSLKGIISGSYLNTNVLYYDEDIPAWCLYTPGIGFQIYQNGSNFTINPDDSITIEHKNTSSIIELNGPVINMTSNATVNVTANTDINIESGVTSLSGTNTTKLGPSPAYSGMLAEPTWAFLKILAAGLDAKLPSTPGVFTDMADKFEQLSTSKNVKMSK